MLKPPVRLGRKPRLKTLMAVGAATVAFGGLAVAQAGPAAADPAASYVAVGSDTVQDVYNQFSLDKAGNFLGSYNAVNPVKATAHEEITPNVAGASASSPTNQCSFTRPNGSTEGLSALRKSINPSTTATQLTAPPQPNCIAIDRSSSGPGTNQSNTGALVYIPFALDALAGSVGPATGGVVGGVTTVPTVITQANLFTLTDLKTLYASCLPITAGGVTYDPTGATGTKIDLYVPQPGSGTRNFWASTLGFSNTTLPACVHDHIVAGGSTGVAVEEHDGTAVVTDPNGYGPFSIAQFISQRNGHNDRRHGVVLQNLNGVFPCSNNTNCSTAGSLNTAFPITREVYSVVLFSSVSPGGSTFDPNLVGLLVGAGSSVCQDQLTIINYGFALLGSGTTDLCGSIANSLRAFDPATNPI